ncbi:MAG: hypothetical protein KAI59_01820, partial [Planctomycetes bacterium]|nr:hypothetical protein [Planctomycetota bacterium]
MDMNVPNSITFASIPIPPAPDLTMEPNEYYVIFNIDDGNNPISHLGYVGTVLEEPNLVLSFGYTVDVNQLTGIPNSGDANFVDTRNLAIRQRVETESGYETIYVDRQLIYKNWARWDPCDWNCPDPNSRIRTYERNFDMEDNSWWYTVYHNMFRDATNSSFGMPHNIGSPDPMPEIDIAMPWDSNSGYLGDLITIGDISRIWTIGPHDYLFDPEDMNEPNDANIYDPNTLLPFEPNDPNNPYDINEPNDANGIYANYNSYSRTVGETLKLVSRSRSKNYDREDLEELIRLNLADADYRNLFQYITVFYPADHDQWAGETRIKGRININTAPWYVISQLPWMRDDIAKAIVAYRDKLDLDPNGPDYSDPNFGRWKATGIYNVREAAGFESIGELATVINDSGEDEYSMHWYALDSTDINSFPDLTLSPDDDADGAEDDFEERDIIFSRISNLVTVR